MTKILKVQGFSNLVRETSSNAIVNTNVADYQLYIKRVRQRENNSDKLRNVCKEINTLKKEFREIKELIKEVSKQ